MSNRNLASIEHWSLILKDKMRRLNWSGASTQLNTGNIRIALTLNELIPSFKRFLDQLANDLRTWRSTGRINPGTMSIEAYEAAEAIARSEYAYVQQMAAAQAANAQRRYAAAQAANAARRAREAAEAENAVRRAREANAQRRETERKAREANAARKAAKQAENEARFAAAEKERLLRAQQAANNAAQNAKKEAHEATKKAEKRFRTEQINTLVEEFTTKPRTKNTLNKYSKILLGKNISKLSKYSLLSLQLHPNKNPSHQREATELFKLLGELKTAKIVQ